MTIAETYKQLTGAELPRPFEEKTAMERRRDWDHFLAVMVQTDDIPDNEMDEFLARAALAFDNTPTSARPNEDTA